jgi:pseudouridine kinase
VTVFGAAHIDRLLRTNGPAILGASNPGHMRDTVGGVALNIASTVARLGVSTRLVTRLGQDESGNRVFKAAIDAGVDPAWIGRSKHHSTATYHAVLDPAGNLVVGVADTHIYDEITPESLADAFAAPASLWVADANLTEVTLAEIAARARAAGIPLAACAVSPSKAVRFAELLPDISIWFGNRGEAEAVLGRAFREATGTELAAGLVSAGVSAGFVTDSKAPFAAWEDQRTEMLRPLPVTKIVSVNGAGDAQAAGTVYGLSKGLGFLDAVRLGLASAALKIETEDPVRNDLTAALLEQRAATASHPA